MVGFDRLMVLSFGLCFFLAGVYMILYRGQSIIANNRIKLAFMIAVIFCVLVPLNIDVYSKYSPGEFWGFLSENVLAIIVMVIFDFVLVYLIYRLINFKAQGMKELAAEKEKEEYWKAKARGFLRGKAPIKMD